MMRKVVLMTLMLIGNFWIRAQELKPFTDEQLTKYAEVMVWAESETESLKNIVRD